MKQHLIAIAFNEKELESYVSQLRNQRFETISDIKKSEDGTFYQALAKVAKYDVPSAAAMVVPSTEIVLQQA